MGLPTPPNQPLFNPPPKPACPIHRGFIAMSGSTDTARPAPVQLTTQASTDTVPVVGLNSQDRLSSEAIPFSNLLYPGWTPRVSPC
ncbi:MAG TPA: hypothetical protein VF865_14685, partial [Acidobacteriaceae bacterium]